MLAIFAIALALGLTTAMVVVPMMPQAFAAGGQSFHREKACNHSGANNHAPFC